MALKLNNSFFKVSNGVFRYVEVSGGGGGQPVTYTITELLTTTGAGTWTKPEGVTSVTVECWGGGGAGGGATDNPSAGAGGGGGQYAKKIITYASASQNISYTVAAGGVGSTVAGTDGGDSTWETNVVIAKGGTGGGANGIVGADAIGGVGNVAGSVGDIIYFGADGFIGLVTSPDNFPSSGFGGGGAGSTGNGGNQFAFTGTPEFGGDGGAGILNLASDGNPGNIYGGGGGGGCAPGAQNRNGGAGAQGLIRVSYTIPAPLDIYTGSIMAASVRKLSESASFCMKVERDSDNQLQDIGFQSDGLIDTGSLLSFCGSATGYVRVWYNQVKPSGSWDFKWSESGFTKPYIVSSGSLVLQNGKPCIFYADGTAGMTTVTSYGAVTSDLERLPVVDSSGRWMTYTVAQVADTTTRVLIRTVDTVSNTNVAQNIRRNTTNIESLPYNAAGSAFTDTSGTNPGTAQFIAFAEREITSIEIFVNNQSNGPTTTTGTNVVTSSVMTLGYFGGSGPGTFPWSGSVQEVVHFPLDPVTFNYRQSLTTIANSFYGIY